MIELLHTDCMAVSFVHCSMAHSEETKRRISEAMKGKLLGRKRSDDAIEKGRESLRKAHAEGRHSGGFKKGNVACDWTGKKHGPETKAKMREAKLKNNPMHRPEVAAKVSRTRIHLGIGRGASNWNWKGGITPEAQRIRSSSEYIQWRGAVFARDNYTCQACGARNGNGNNVTLNAHHLKPFATHALLRFELSNGQTLCKPCHDKEPKGKRVYAIH